jgi:hypothetical protein
MLRRFPRAANTLLCYAFVDTPEKVKKFLVKKVAKSSNDFSEVLVGNPDIGTSSDEDASGFVIEGLTILRNSGCDSAGLATVSSSGNELLVTKYASRGSTSDSIDLIRVNSVKHDDHVTGIGHTRWIAHCGKTDLNSR